MPQEIAIITRQAARYRHLKRFFTGEPCQHGHVCERYVKRSWCVECARQSLMRGWRAERRRGTRGEPSGRIIREGPPFATICYRGYRETGGPPFFFLSHKREPLSLF
jgi:hypothetical protein